MRKAGTEKARAEAKTFDITEQELYVLDENFYYDCECGTFVGLYEYNFRPEEYFGPLTAGDPILCFATEWSMNTDDVSMYYWGNFEESRRAEELEKVLTEKEKAFFKELMDQICMEKYGILISELHKPLAPEEKEDIVSLLRESMDDEENDMDLDSPSDGYMEDGEEGWEDGEETEFNVLIEMVVTFPRQHTPDMETGMRDVSAAFEEAGVGSWAYGAGARMDDDMLWIKLTTSVMTDDSMAAEDFCEETLGQVKAILKKKGYCAEDVSCTAEES